MKGFAQRLLVGALLCAACNSEAPPMRDLEPGDAKPVDVEAPPGDALYALTDAQRETLSERLARAELAQRGTEGGVKLARELARVATAIVRLGGSTRHIAPARAALRAALETDADGACDAALDLSRLLAGPVRDLPAAHAAAARAVRRFAGESGATLCVREARRVMAVLAEHAGSELAREGVDGVDGARAIGSALAADGTGSGDGEGLAQDESVAHDASRQWADFTQGGAGQDAPSTTLEEIVIYGADAAGERPLSEREVRVVLRFSGVAVYRRGLLPAQGGLPRRIFLDLDRAALANGLPMVREVGAGGLARVRVVPLGPETTRVSFDVGAATAYRLFFLTDPYRVVMDFRDQDSAGQARARAGATTIVLDPGHGGEQPGAKGPEGLKESNVALSLARRVRASIRRQRPDVRVVLTRDEDRFLTLEERTAIANGYDADLFLSIHLNASHSSDDKGGVATFVLDTTDDQAALRLAARENGTDEAGVTQLQFILASLYRADQVQRSLSLANEVQRATLQAGREILPNLFDRGVKRALFYVLVGARMPAALVEASFITRPEEARALHSDEYRDALSEGIAAGVVRYLERRKKPPSD